MFVNGPYLVFGVFLLFLGGHRLSCGHFLVFYRPHHSALLLLVVGSIWVVYINMGLISDLVAESASCPSLLSSVAPHGLSWSGWSRLCQASPLSRPCETEPWDIPNVC